MPKLKLKLTSVQPRRSARTPSLPRRYEDDSIPKKKSRTNNKTISKRKLKITSKVKPIKPIKAKPTKSTRSKPKPKIQKSTLNFFGTNSSDGRNISVVLNDRDPEYIHKPLEGPTNREYQRIGQRLTIPSNKLNHFQLASIRARKRKESDVIIREMDELADSFSYLKTPGFT